MKKLFTIFLCLAMAVSFAACNKGETATEATTEPITTRATTAATEELAPTEAETTAPSVQETQPAPSEGAVDSSAPAIQKLTQQEQFELLASVVGMDITEAVEKLGWAENEVSWDDIYATLPLKIYLNGTEFQVLLGNHANDFKVNEVLFSAELPTDPEKVAQAAVKTVALVDKWVGKENQLEAMGSVSLRDTTQQEIADGISWDEMAYSMITWDYSKKADKITQEYMESSSEELGMDGVYGVYFEVSRSCKVEGDQVVSDTCSIVISLGLVTLPEV